MGASIEQPSSADIQERLQEVAAAALARVETVLEVEDAREAVGRSVAREAYRRDVPASSLVGHPRLPTSDRRISAWIRAPHQGDLSDALEIDNAVDRYDLALADYHQATRRLIHALRACPGVALRTLGEAADLSPEGARGLRRTAPGAALGFPSMTAHGHLYTQLRADSALRARLRARRLAARPPAA